MTEFEPGSSAIGSEHSANCATTTAHYYMGDERIHILMAYQNSDTIQLSTKFQLRRPLQGVDVINKFQS